MSSGGIERPIEECTKRYSEPSNNIDGVLLAPLEGLAWLYRGYRLSQHQHVYRSWGFRLRTLSFAGTACYEQGT